MAKASLDQWDIYNVLIHLSRIFSISFETERSVNSRLQSALAQDSRPQRNFRLGERAGTSPEAGQT